MSPEKEFDFCLLIPCYNNRVGLVRSLLSVKYDTARYYVLIVDDGSAEAVDAASLKTEINGDMSLYVLRKTVNEGITKALNDGLKWIERRDDVRYVARLDCGDTCSEERFYKQVKLLDINKQMVLLGTWCTFRRPDTGQEYVYRTPTDHHSIAKGMYYRNLYIHPTIIFRLTTARAVNYYPENFEYAEDYAFCWQLMNEGEGHIMDEALVCCEISDTGISLRNKRKQLKARWKVVKKFAPRTIRKIAGYIRLLTLFLLPAQVTLWLKLLRK
ncbi:MAG: glycosyltransferase [Chitinophagaceae bacterium]